MSQAGKRSFEVRGVHVLAAMLAFFGAVIAVNVVFAVIAVRSFPGEDVRRSYLQGLRYNETLADRRAQAALGWSAQVSLAAAPDGAVLELRLNDRDGAPIDGAHIAGALQWPTDASRDRALRFASAGDGRYVAALGTLSPGQWRLRARAERDDAHGLDLEAGLTWQVSR